MIETRPPWIAFLERCETASSEELVRIHREREAEWDRVQRAAGLDPTDPAQRLACVRALMAAGEVSQAHGAMMLRAAAII